MHQLSGSVLVLLALVACDRDRGPDDLGLPIGKVAVYLTPDAHLGGVPDAVDAVWLRVEDVLVRHETNGWVPVTHAHEDINLMALRGGSRVPIGSGPMYEGAFDALQLYVTDAWIVVDGEVKDLALTPGPSSEAVVLRGDFVVGRAATTSLVVRWDLDLQLTQGSGGWSLAADSVVGVDRDAG